MKKKTCVKTFAGLLLLLMLTGCTSAMADPAANLSPPVEEAGRTYAVVFPIVHPFFEPVGKDAEDFGNEYDWDIIIKAPDHADAGLQIKIMDELIEMGVDGIAIGPTDPEALVGVINTALSKGIKVICFETDAPDSDRLGYVGTNNYNAGRHMGYVIGKTLGEQGNILILTGLSTQMSLNERIRGIEEYLMENYPNINILDIRSSEGDAKAAVSMTEALLEMYPDFDAIIGIDATAGPAAVSVWKKQNWRNNNKMIITFDDMPENLQGVRDGYIKAIVSQRQNTWGQGVLLLLNSLVEGREIPDYIDTGSIEITTANIETYLDETSWLEPGGD
ncbi:MAG: substrate-binding domain-containing protein [Lachnospiraceae bacterium]|nr:substrate-binding domain-containing protein [Lachnospiraceae bacterium]